jgi:medium-chain acyl-[acyl-carrier-protein] hydrolase
MWSQTYQITGLMTDHRSELGLIGLLEVTQDMALQHARRINISREEMDSRRLFWALTRQNFVIERAPRLSETLTVQTWVRVTPEGLVMREFRLQAEQEPIATSVTAWLPLDVKTRKPVRQDVLPLLAGVARAETTGLQTPKVHPSPPFVTRAVWEVRNSDIDHNDHVNNIRYAHWVLDALAFATFRECRIRGYEVNFLAETRLGEKIRIEQGAAGEVPEFRGVREGDQKVVFTSRLTFR